MRYEKLLAVLFFLTLFMTGVMESIFAGILPMISHDFLITDSMSGQLITIYALTFALSGPFLIKSVKRYSHKKVICFSMLLFAFSNFATAISSNFIVLVFSRIMCAMVAAILTTKSLESCFIFFGSNKQKLAFVNMGFSSSIAIGVPLGTYFSSLFSWQTFFMCIGIVSLCIAILLRKILPNDEVLYSQQKSEVETIQDRKLIPKQIGKLLATNLCILTANMIFVGYITSYVSTKYELSNMGVILTLFCLGIGGVSGSMLSTYFLKKLSIKTALIYHLLVFSVCLIIFPLLPITAFLVTVFLWSVSEWSTGPIIQYAIAQYSDESVREHFISLNISCINVGSAIGSALGGVYILYLPIDQLPLFALLFAACSLFMVTLLESSDNIPVSNAK